MTRFPALLFAGLTCAAAPAAAQVTLDLHALEPGQPEAPPSSSNPTPPARHGRTQHPAASARRGEKPAARAGGAPAQPVVPTARLPAAQPSTAQPLAAQPSATGPLPPIPTAPPPEVPIAPIVVQPSSEKPESPVAPVSADAGGGVEAMPGGMRILFSPSRADLTPASESALKSYVAALPGRDEMSFNIVAYAAGGPEDPSTPRRLSLSRALAIRSVLLAAGVASPRIYLRALGTAHADGPADRVDLAPVDAGGRHASADAPK